MSKRSTTGGIYAMNVDDTEPTKTSMEFVGSFDVWGYSWESCLKAREERIQNETDAVETFQRLRGNSDTFEIED